MAGDSASDIANGNVNVHSVLQLTMEELARIETYLGDYVDNGIENAKSEVNAFSFFPKMIFEKPEEDLHLRLVEDIINNGVSKDDMNGAGRLSKFGCQMRFNLRKSFPLLTTKKEFWRGAVEELLWFISGSTNAKVLQEKGIHIWDGKASREYLDSIGLEDREEGDLGPIYGFQWRHFGATYTDMHADYTGQGFDQLLDVINKIKQNPNDRRIILCAWNPSNLKLMAVPPCHLFAQFWVANGELSCQMYLQSADMSLGLPFNIASYSLLTCMIAHVSGLSPGELIHVTGDAHVYKTHIRPLQDQLQKLPRPFPMVSEEHEEYLYLRLVEDIINNGVSKDDRTGTGTLSKFGCQMRFNLRKSFPLLTTKKVFWRGVVEELLWFISGSTNAKALQEKGIHIWDGNASRDYLDSIGLEDREEGDLGPVYGFQWRHFGATYTDMHADYTGQGFDQLLDVISKIKHNPDDGCIFLSAWNPPDLKLMALPPCHMFAHFSVANGELSCLMYQRSADMGLGVPFNIASYSLLTCMIAHVCGLSPGDFVHVIGDAHVYKTHVRPLQDQLQKSPRDFPILKINPEKQDIKSFNAADFKLIGYDPHQKIEMKMAV